jgi:hypothetical protein
MFLAIKNKIKPITKKVMGKKKSMLSVNRVNKNDRNPMVMNRIANMAIRRRYNLYHLPIVLIFIKFHHLLLMNNLALSQVYFIIEWDKGQDQDEL